MPSMSSRRVMIYNVRMTERAKEQMEAFVRYLVTELKNKQAASNLLEDVMDTEESLTYVAGSLPLCGDPDLHRRGIRKIHFSRHRYLWLYQIQEETVYIMAMYHELQDYENCFKNNE